MREHQPEMQAEPGPGSIRRVQNEAQTEARREAQSEFMTEHSSRQNAGKAEAEE